MAATFPGCQEAIAFLIRILTVGPNQVEPELEKALDSMVQLKGHMSNLIANPPQPVK